MEASERGRALVATFHEEAKSPKNRIRRSHTCIAAGQALLDYIATLEGWMAESMLLHDEAGHVLPDAHGAPHRRLVERYNAILGTDE